MELKQKLRVKYRCMCANINCVFIQAKCCPNSDLCCVPYTYVFGGIMVYENATLSWHISCAP